MSDIEDPHTSDCAIWSGEDCDCMWGKPMREEDYEPPHYQWCICADCSDAELTAEND